MILRSWAYCIAEATCFKYSFFVFQAEDGIRGLYVTGVQTCALPISPATATAVVLVTRNCLRGCVVATGAGRCGGTQDAPGSGVPASASCSGAPVPCPSQPRSSAAESSAGRVTPVSALAARTSRIIVTAAAAPPTRTGTA